MNKERRAMIAKAVAMMDAARGILEDAANEEREYFDNMPESLQNGDKGQKAGEAADALEEAVSSLEDLVGQVEDAANG